MGGPGSGGRNALLIEAHVRRGTHRRDRHPPLNAPMEALPPAPGSLTPAARAHYARLRRDLAGRASRGDATAVMLVASVLAVALDPPAEGSPAPTAAEKSAAWSNAMRGLGILGLIPALSRRSSANGSVPAAPGVDVAGYTTAGPR
jgi:hypothetical protein